MVEPRTVTISTHNVWQSHGTHGKGDVAGEHLAGGSHSGVAGCIRREAKPHDIASR